MIGLVLVIFNNNISCSSPASSSAPPPPPPLADRDENLIAVLDKLVFYLRLVHSFDYYNAIEYPSEDEMPNRCGIIHARGPDPTGMNPPTKVGLLERAFGFLDCLRVVHHFSLRYDLCF